MIQVTAEQAAQIEEIRAKSRIRGGVRINTIIIYQLWPLLFGVSKKPNGCNSCLRADLNAFMTKWDHLKNHGELEILGQEGEEAPTE